MSHSSEPCLVIPQKGLGGSWFYRMRLMTIRRSGSQTLIRRFFKSAILCSRLKADPGRPGRFPEIISGATLDFFYTLKNNYSFKNPRPAKICANRAEQWSHVSNSFGSIPSHAKTRILSHPSAAYAAFCSVVRDIQRVRIHESYQEGVDRV